MIYMIYDMGIGLIKRATDQASTSIPPRAHGIPGKIGSRLLIWFDCDYGKDK